MKTKRQDLIKNSNKTVFITTYGLMREDIDYYEQINYHAVILDEAQNIKNPHAGITKSSKRLKSFVKFALTGTPLEIVLLNFGVYLTLLCLDIYLSLISFLQNIKFMSLMIKLMNY